MYHNGLKCITMIASTDLSSGAQHHIVDQVANVPFKMTGAAAGLGFGILQNSPRAGEHGTVAVEGESEVRVGLAVQAGQYCVSAASGWAIGVASTTANVVLGRYMTGAASGMLAVVNLQPYRGVTA
jgi:hypothetical protein